jgi:hypothetical protein
MPSLKSKVIYHGGSLPVPSRLQKGLIQLEAESLHVTAKGETRRYDLDLHIPLDRITRVRAEERKYYSSVGYFLVIEYAGDGERPERLELEIRSFVRRGRAQAISRLWAETLSGQS